MSTHIKNTKRVIYNQKKKKEIHFLEIINIALLYFMKMAKFENF